MKNMPIRPSEHLAEFLHEQAETTEDERDIARLLNALDQWQAPVPTPAENEQLSKRLMSFVPTNSLVRKTLHEKRQGIWNELGLLLKLVRAQVSLLRPAFWLTSALIVLLGCLLVLNEANLSRTVALQIIGPLLCYLGAASVFRGIGLNILELELACPPSPRQLTIARLVIVLGYDIGLGLIASLLLSAQGNEGILALMLHWAAPLLLVFGLTLLFSLRIPIHQAGALTYTAWLVFLVFRLLSTDMLREATGAFSISIEGIFSVVGLILLLVAVGYTPWSSLHLFPRQ